MPRTHKVLVATAQRGCAHNTHLQQHFQRSPSTSVPTPPGHNTPDCAHLLSGRLGWSHRLPCWGPIDNNAHSVHSLQTSNITAPVRVQNSRHLTSFPQPIRVRKKPHFCLATVLFESKDRWRLLHMCITSPELIYSVSSTAKAKACVN